MMCIGRHFSHLVHSLFIYFCCLLEQRAIIPTNIWARLYVKFMYVVAVALQTTVLYSIDLSQQNELMREMEKYQTELQEL